MSATNVKLLLEFIVIHDEYILNCILNRIYLYFKFLRKIQKLYFTNHIPTYFNLIHVRLHS
jgi:hypothetical protein